MKAKRFWIIAPLIVVTVGAALWATGRLPFVSAGEGVAVADTTGVPAAAEVAEGDDAEERPVPVEVALVEGRGIASFYRAASVIEADRLVDLTARTLGRVHAVNVEEGDWIEEGKILAELENDRERIQVRKAELTLKDKKRLLERTQGMLDEELVSRQDFDDAKSAMQLAEAERDLAKIALEDTRIRAPFAGRVIDRRVVPGQQVVAGATTFTLGDFTPLRVRVHLPEAVARKVQSGQRVLISPEAVDTPLEGVVERISPVVDPATSTVRLTLLLNDAEGPASVGGFVKVRITTDEHFDALAIPKLALVEEGALRSVFVAEADTVRKVEIRTGLYDETHVEILEGLFDGDFIVTMGQGGLRTGSNIRVLNAEALGYGGGDAAGEKVDPIEDPGAMTALAELE